MNRLELRHEFHDPAAGAVPAGEDQPAVPGTVAKIYADPKDALADIETADAAYGTVPPELFARAKKSLDLCLPAGLGGERHVGIGPQPVICDGLDVVGLGQELAQLET